MFELIKSLIFPMFLIYFIANQMAYSKYMDTQGLPIDKKLNHQTFETFLFADSNNHKIKRITIFANLFRAGFFIALFINAIAINKSLSQFSHQFVGNVFLMAIVIMIVKSLYELGKQISNVYQERENS